MPDSDRWLILVVIGIAQLMVVLDVTIVNIALPSAQRDLGFSDDDRQWVITAYALAFGSLLLLGGRIADLFGRKWTFIVGLLGFAGASALGGAARELRRARRRARAAGRLRRAARPGRAVAADDDVHRSGRARQGVRHLRRDRRHGRRDRAAARRRADRDARLALVPVRLDRLRRPGGDRRRAAAATTCRSARARGSTSAGRCSRLGGLFALVFGLARARVRRLGRCGDARVPDRQRRPAGRVRRASSGASRSRCCRCGSSPTATVARRSWRSAPRAPACSRCSCS